MKDLSLTTTLLLLLSYILIGYATSMYAARKNRNRKAWFLLGFFFGIMAGITLFALPKIEEIERPLSKNEDHPFLGTIWYYLDENHSQVGPVSFEALKEAHLLTKLSPDSYIGGEEMKDWAPLKANPELLKAIDSSV